MIRKIIKIDEEKCNGCGLCANACHEGAIGIQNGKAKLLRDDYCDGLGNCLPACPTGAITFEEREAAAYDEQAVIARMNPKPAERESSHQGCPGTRARQFAARDVRAEAVSDTQPQSELRQWPVQIKLAPLRAPYYNNARLLIAADCSAFAHGDFHRRFMRGHITLIGCPKLDSGDYSEKLTEIIRLNEIKSVKVVRMEVPCCGGIEHAVKNAIKQSGKTLPWQVVTLSTDGEIIDE